MRDGRRPLCCQKQRSAEQNKATLHSKAYLPPTTSKTFLKRWKSYYSQSERQSLDETWRARSEQPWKYGRKAHRAYVTRMDGSVTSVHRILGTTLSQQRFRHGLLKLPEASVFQCIRTSTLPVFETLPIRNKARTTSSPGPLMPAQTHRATKDDWLQESDQPVKPRLLDGSVFIAPMSPQSSTENIEPARSRENLQGFNKSC